MKKSLLALLFAVALFVQHSAEAQTAPRKTLTISFISNDFTTAQRIRSSSLASVLRDKQVSKLRDMSHGFAATYTKGLTPHTDLAVTAGGTFARVPLTNRNFSNDNFFLEVDASGNFRMLPEGATVNPYLIAGVGASKYTNVYGAFIPLGTGIRVNIANEALVQIQLQYRIPVTPDANAHHFQVGFGIGGVL